MKCSVCGHINLWLHPNGEVVLCTRCGVWHSRKVLEGTFFEMKVPETLPPPTPAAGVQQVAFRHLGRIMSEMRQGKVLRVPVADSDFGRAVWAEVVDCLSPRQMRLIEVHWVKEEDDADTSS